ncbi:MAG: hypothetical protein ACXAC7_09340 [Candidatus Hodarchaeales archaeon]
MKIFIKNFGQLRSLTKDPMISLDVKENSSFLDVLDFFIEKFGPTAKKLLYNDESGKINSFYTIMIQNNNNNITIDQNELGKTAVNEGQVILIVPFIGGG